MTPDQEKILVEVRDALVGNKNTGTIGIIDRVGILEAYQEKDQKFKERVAGGLFVSVPIFGIVAEYLKHHMLKL